LAIGSKIEVFRNLTFEADDRVSGGHRLLSNPGWLATSSGSANAAFVARHITVQCNTRTQRRYHMHEERTRTILTEAIEALGLQPSEVAARLGLQGEGVLNMMLHPPCQ
jgi:hypothetical protein